MKVLIVDDHPSVILGCQAMLAPCGDITVSGAADADEAYEAYISGRPDIVVTDIELPIASGFVLIQRILRRDPAARVIVFTMSDELISAARAIRNGAKGYISKSEDPARLVAAIREVAAGRAFMPPELAQKLALRKPGYGSDVLAELGVRELKILRLLCKGKSRAEISRLTGVSYRTVARNCARLRRKLGANTLTDVVRIAVENGLA